jgi:MATE family multidrug resistance protein
LQIALGTNLVIGVVVGLAAVVGVEPLFHVFTSHGELIESAKVYIDWIPLVVVSAGFAYILDGYFAGLSEGGAVRNSYLVSGFLGITSLCLATFYFHSNHFLWLALSLFMISCTLILGLQIPMTLQTNEESNEEKEAVVNL